MITLFSCPVATQAKSTVQVDDILCKMLQVGHDLNMRGTQVFFNMRGKVNTTCTKRVVRSASGRNVVTTLEPASQRGCVTLDDGAWKTVYNPRLHVATVTRAASRLSSRRDAMRMVRLIRRNYAVAYIGLEPIAGRSCHRLDLTPYSKASYPCSIWIDTVSGAVLSHRESFWTSDTSTLMLFTSVQYPHAIPAHELVAKIPANARRTNLSRSTVMRNVAHLERRLGYKINLPIAMPGGFEFDSCELVELDGAYAACLHYTDGLSNLTICQSRAKARRPLGYRMLQASYQPQGDLMVASSMGDRDYMVIGHGTLEGLTRVAGALDEARERSLVQRLQHEYKLTNPDFEYARATGVTMDVLTVLLEIARRSKRKVGGLLSEYRWSWDWRGLAQRLRIDPQQAQLAAQRMLMQ